MPEENLRHFFWFDFEVSLSLVQDCSLNQLRQNLFPVLIA
jgi:hypothetical protein